MSALTAVRAERVAWRLLATGLVCELMLSAQGLFALGIPYDAVWGNVIAKLHPGTYLTLAAALTALASHGNPLVVAAAALRREPWLAAYIAGMGFVFAYSVLHNGPSGAAFIIDTLMVPAVTVLTLGLLQPQRSRQCLWWLLLPLTVNAVLGIGEALLRARAIPLIIAGTYEAIDTSFRPSALMGHPLINALATATLLPLPLFLRIPAIWRAAWVGLLWVALLAFGGRASFLVATALYGAHALGCALHGALRGRWSYLQIVAALLGVLLVPTLLAGGIVASGLGERIFQSLQWDSSAQVRARIWEMPGYLGARDTLFGISPHDIDVLSARIGLEATSEAVENFWLSMFLQLGLVGFVPFVLAMGCAVRWMWVASPTLLRISMAVFFLSASGFNSLASKTVCLTLLFVAVAATRERAPRRAPVSWRVPVPWPAPVGSAAPSSRTAWPSAAS